MAFDNTKYGIEYRKTHKRKVNLDINPDEHELLEKIVKELKITKVQVFRKGLEYYLKKIDIKKEEDN